jgi:hypothetical protein
LSAPAAIGHYYRVMGQSSVIRKPNLRRLKVALVSVAEVVAVGALFRCSREGGYSVPDNRATPSKASQENPWTRRAALG